MLLTDVCHLLIAFHNYANLMVNSANPNLSHNVSYKLYGSWKKLYELGIELLPSLFNSQQLLHPTKCSLNMFAIFELPFIAMQI